MKKKINFKFDNSYIYLFMIGLLNIIMAFYQPLLSFIGFIILGYLIFHNIKAINKKKRELVKLVESLSQEFDSATKHAIFNMPFPLVILDENMGVSWYNTPFLKMMEEREILFQGYLWMEFLKIMI